MTGGGNVTAVSAAENYNEIDGKKEGAAQDDLTYQGLERSLYLAG